MRSCGGNVAGEEGRIRLKGRVFSGFGEGGFYVSLEHYRKQFKEKLGFDPYPGTLNLKLDADSMKARRILTVKDGIRIEPYSDGQKCYCGAKCFMVLIEGKIRGAIVVPEVTRYGDDVIELLAPVYLRRALKLRDGDQVTVEILDY